MTADILQYGALGLLAIVLYGLFSLARLWFQRMFEQNDESFKFVRDQVNTANAERAGHFTAWIEMHREQIQMSVITAESLAEIRNSLGQIQQYLQNMNGGSKK